MAQISLPPMDLLQVAAAALASRSAGDTPRIHAINRAAYYFSIGNVTIAETSGGFFVTSGSRAGIIHRLDNVAGCSCEGARGGARACWHAAALEIIIESRRYSMPVLIRERSAAAVKAFAEMNELYS